MAEDPPKVETPATVAEVPLPLPVVPTCEQMAAAAMATLGGLPADRSGPVHWDHVTRMLWVPNT